MSVDESTEWDIPEDMEWPEPVEWTPPEDVTPAEIAESMSDETFDGMTRTWARLTARVARVDARAHAMLDRIHAEAAAQEAAVNDWAARVKKRDEDYIAVMEDILGRHILAVRDRTGGKVKSRTSPWAKVSTVTSGGRWVPSDETLEWAVRECPAAVKTTHALMVSSLKRIPGVRAVDGVAITAAAEAIPGITVEPARVVAKIMEVKAVDE